MTRMEAIQDIRCGRGIQVAFQGIEELRPGMPHNFTVIIRRQVKDTVVTGKVEAVFDCTIMRHTYKLILTSKQVMSFIKRNYATGEMMPETQRAA